jgi:hypothetical protein
MQNYKLFLLLSLLISNVKELMFSLIESTYKCSLLCQALAGDTAMNSGQDPSPQGPCNSARETDIKQVDKNIAYDHC